MVQLISMAHSLKLLIYSEVVTLILYLATGTCHVMLILLILLVFLIIKDYSNFSKFLRAYNDSVIQKKGQEITRIVRSSSIVDYVDRDTQVLHKLYRWLSVSQ